MVNHPFWHNWPKKKRNLREWCRRISLLASGLGATIRLVGNQTVFEASAAFHFCFSFRWSAFDALHRRTTTSVFTNHRQDITLKEKNWTIQFWSCTQKWSMNHLKNGLRHFNSIESNERENKYSWLDINNTWPENTWQYLARYQQYLYSKHRHLVEDSGKDSKCILPDIDNTFGTWIVV